MKKPTKIHTQSSRAVMTTMKMSTDSEVEPLLQHEQRKDVTKGQPVVVKDIGKIRQDLVAVLEAQQIKPVTKAKVTKKAWHALKPSATTGNPFFREGDGTLLTDSAVH